jgi:hypothetical protein
LKCCDWSSDVCSSDLAASPGLGWKAAHLPITFIPVESSS